MVINDCYFGLNPFLTSMAQLDCDGSSACSQSLQLDKSTFLGLGQWFSLNNSVSNSGTQNLTVVNSNFTSTNNGVFYMTSGLYSSVNIDINIQASQFSENNAPGRSGGVLRIDSPLSDVTLTVIDSSFRDSLATYDGGAFYVHTSQLNMTLINPTIDKMSAHGHGGFMYLLLDEYGANATILFSDGSANGNTAHNGGVLYINSTTPVNVTMLGTSFSMNNAVDNGSVVFATGPTLALNMVGGNVQNHTVEIPFVLDGGRVTVSVNDSLFEYNSAGTIFALNDTGPSAQLHFNAFNNTWHANQVSTNDANSFGGCIRFWCLNTCTQTVNLTSNTFSNNTHNLAGGVLAMVSQNGTLDQTLDLNNNTWVGNQANDGGCIYLTGPSQGFQSISVDGDNVSENTAQNNGGFIFVNHTFQTLSLTRSHFSHNSAVGNGGVVFMEANTSLAVTVQDCVVSDSEAKIGSVFYGVTFGSQSPSIRVTLISNQFLNHNTATLFNLQSENSIVNSTANQYTNNAITDSHVTIQAKAGYFLSDSDLILQVAGRWVYLEAPLQGINDTTDQLVNISGLTASNPPRQLLNMTTYSAGSQDLLLSYVNITGEGSSLTPSNSSFIAMQGSGTMTQFLNVNHSVISQVSGTTFSLTANGTLSDVISQTVYILNTTMKQLVTSDFGALYLNASDGSTQILEWGDSHWEDCQGTLLWLNRLNTMQIYNCQFEQNKALNGSLLAVTGGVANFTSNRFINNQAKDAVINLSGHMQSFFVNHTVVNDSPLHLWVTNDTSEVELVSVNATYMTFTPLLGQWNVRSTYSQLGTLEVTLLNGTSNVTLLSYGNQPKAWTSAVVNYVNTTRGCFNNGQVRYNATQAFAVLDPVPCLALNIPPNTTANVTVTGIVVLYPNQTLNISTGVIIQVEEGGCVLLEGDLHLRLDASALPNSQQLLIQGCFDGEFGNITFDNTDNPQICQVSTIYASSQVLLNLQACDNPLAKVSTPPSTVPVGAIVGGVVGGVAFVALVVILVIYLVKRHQRKRMAKDLTTMLKANHS